MTLYLLGKGRDFCTCYVGAGTFVQVGAGTFVPVR